MLIKYEEQLESQYASFESIGEPHRYKVSRVLTRADLSTPSYVKHFSKIAYSDKAEVKYVTIKTL